jgi:hypothetical protein
MINITLVKLISKYQKTVETSTNGSELVASRIGTELILKVRYMLQIKMQTLTHEYHDILFTDEFQDFMSTLIQDMEYVKTTIPS